MLPYQRHSGYQVCLSSTFAIGFFIAYLYSYFSFKFSNKSFYPVWPNSDLLWFNRSSNFFHLFIESLDIDSIRLSFFWTFITTAKRCIFILHRKTTYMHSITCERALNECLSLWPVNQIFGVQLSSRDFSFYPGVELDSILWLKFTTGWLE